MSPENRVLVTAIFLASGAASLILQVLWFKQLQFVLGSATVSVSVTVASFFFGLSLGSVFGGRIADTVSRPLKVYGFLELALALVSLAVTAFLSHWSTWVGWLSPMLDLESPLRLPLMVALSLAILSLPTMLMGATLPFLVKYLTRTRTDLAHRIGLLYGFNTLGAAIGTLVVGFVLMGLWGITGSSLVAAALYVCVGAVALLLARSASPLVPVTVEVPAQTVGSGHGRTPVLIWIFACSGFVSIAYEVVWFRFLTNVSTSSVYAFSGMLGVYLLGLVIGALICAKVLAPRKDQLLRYFAVTQLLIAVAATLTVATLGKARTLQVALAPIVSSLVPLQAQELLGGDVSFFLTCAVALLLPTTLIGISFPLASELTVMQMSALGRRIGSLYALNTIGGVLGSLAAGFLLIPYLGSQWALTVLIALNVLLFVVTTVSQPDLLRERGLWRQGAIAASVIAASLLLITPHYLERVLTAIEGGNVLELQETRQATFAVVEYQDKAAGTYQQLVVNSKSYANNRPEGRRYMAAMGHYPILLHRGPVETAVVICIGTGTTVGAVSTHQELKSIDAVDLASTVFEVAPHFVPLNKQFYQNPKVHQIVADGRHFLLGTKQTFDAVTLEPPPPHDAGVINLYTEEFYALAKQRMRPGGVLAQWVPLDFNRGILPKMILKAMMGQFKHVSLWLPSRMEGVAIASDEPLNIDPRALAMRMSEPAVADDLTANGLRSPEDFLATFIAADEKLAAFVGDVPSLTDDRPRLEYYNWYPLSAISVDELKRLREPVELYLADGSIDEARLDTARTVANAILDEHKASADGDTSAARAALRVAVKLEPDNSYVGFLDRKLRE
ncbi:fused MFS/spermidine synthase [Bradyrhizobium genosp. L]|uniref:fused MFS/spermidine synthase n=1 Tax=Bradyrhizobium genosp. L TaxID=83637 RepID=UPI0018A30550|nr:fused MFS/spermidine synthase [Bradyrhizobium genosp. L]QPF85156.1 fused MFS/spermidine synthase [Bradyrhizobium genosp. L]